MYRESRPQIFCGIIVATLTIAAMFTLSAAIVTIAPASAWAQNPTLQAGASNQAALRPALAGNRDALAQQQLLYANGPTTGICDIQNCSVNAWAINYGLATTNSFTLSSASTVNTINVAVWRLVEDEGNTPWTSVDWQIGTTPFASDIAQGTASGSHLIPHFIANPNAPVYMLSISSLNLPLAAGDYWLTLANAQLRNDGVVYWDENNGPSTAEFDGQGPVPSESFNVSDGPVFTCAEPQGNLKTIHDFTGHGDGAGPSGVNIDRAGNLYGATYNRVGDEYGLVYQLSLKNQSWIFTPLYSFPGGDNGQRPTTPIIGSDGIFYGLAEGPGQGSGMLYSLSPSPTACRTALCKWTGNVLYRNGWDWGQSTNLISGGPHHLYQVQASGGTGTNGVAVEFLHANGGWVENVIWNFRRQNGTQPRDLLLGSDGNLYGVAPNGGQFGWGTVFQLTRSGTGWLLNVIYNFQGQSDGYGPYALIQDSSGNLLGVAGYGPQHDHSQSTIFTLSPSNGNWVFTTLKSTVGHSFENYGSLAADAAGNLYVISSGGDADGAGVNHILNYILKGARQGNSWTWTTPVYFADQFFYNYGPLAVDEQGNLYGTTFDCGRYGYGTVWQLSP